MRRLSFLFSSTRARCYRSMRTGRAKPKRGTTVRNSRDSSRPRGTIIGQSVRAGLVSVKGADLTVNKYVGRFHNDVSTENVKSYIEDQGVSVVELELLDTKHQRFKSFRIRFKRSQLGKVVDGEFWPEGVIVSPFFRPRVNGTNPASPNTS